MQSLLDVLINDVSESSFTDSIGPASHGLVTEHSRFRGNRGSDLRGGIKAREVCSPLLSLLCLLCLSVGLMVSPGCAVALVADIALCLTPWTGPQTLTAVFLLAQYVPFAYHLQDPHFFHSNLSAYSEQAQIPSRFSSNEDEAKPAVAS